MKQEPFIRTRVLVAMGAALGVAVTCFIVVAVLPAPGVPLFKDALRSFLTGLGVLGIAYPAYATGLAIKKRFAFSPYFEAGFIAAAINLFGFVCLAVGLICIGFGIYDLVLRMLPS